MGLDEKRVTILGSTGSVGSNALSVIDRLKDFQLDGLVAHSKWEQLLEQITLYHPRWVALEDSRAADRLSEKIRPHTVEIISGRQKICEKLAGNRIDVILQSISGAAGLEISFAALRGARRLALANKETLVIAGELFLAEAAELNVEIIPVDSEHSAIFQCLACGRQEEVKRLILTASGGPFLKSSSDHMEKVSPKEALSHPTWNMGPRITINSATLMNKALEIIEACHLFRISPEQVEVVIHPQSIVHSFVEFVDGSVIAQLGSPDMCLPIQYALTYPERIPSPLKKLDLGGLQKLEFQSPDDQRFPALKLGYRVAKQRGTSGAVLNAANEVAVDAFLAEEIAFPQICRVVEEVLETTPSRNTAAFEEIKDIDRLAREKAQQIICRQTSA